MICNTAFGPIVQGLAASALSNGLGDSFSRIGISRDRLNRAAEMTSASEFLRPREVGALAYAQGLSGNDTALLAFGSGRSFAMRPSVDRIARLGSAKASWWSDPVTRVSDLGTGATRQMIGAALGLDLGRMANSDPLPVPADTRFAALAQLVLGEHWELAMGIRDQAWIESLNHAHKDIAVQCFLTKDELEEQDEERELYHHVNVPCVPATIAAETFGAGVGMVLAQGNNWLQLYVRVCRNKLEVRVSHLNKFWRETGRGMRFGVAGLNFFVPSLAEVGSELVKLAPDATSWKVVALRFPSNALAPAAVEEERRLA